LHVPHKPWEAAARGHDGSNGGNLLERRQRWSGR
jgi:hypothetical protein